MTSPTPSLSTPARAWALLPVQLFLTGLITYIVIAAWMIIGGVVTESGQMFFWAFLSTPVTILAFLLGLPFRVALPAREWWVRHPSWTLALAGVGLAGLALSYVVGAAGAVHYEQTLGRPSTDGYVPDARVFWVSLVVLAVAIMHLRPPVSRTDVARTP